MTLPEAANRVDAVLDEYSKIGVLIDDAADAEGRAARTLYGCEAIPGWWLVCRSLACSIRVLEQLLLRIQSSGPPNAIVVVDRYLQTSCQQQARVIPWDVPPETLGPDEKEHCIRLRELVKEVIKLAEDRESGVFVELETSYPHRLPAPTSGDTESLSPFSWRTRNPDLLYRMRRDIEKARKGDLLEFGPNRKTQKPGYNFTSEDSKAAWTARVYRKALEGIADALHRRDPVVLLTGAGASFRVSRLGRGISSTSGLLEEACWQFSTQQGHTPEPLDPLEDRKPPRCVCSPPEEQVAAGARERWGKGTGKTPIQWLVEHFRNKTPFSTLDWQLEQLFFEEHNLEEDPEEFRRGFRAALHHQDHGFLYHHWLLAQMPWHQIITTNFDGFHERAAASAAAKADPGSRRDILRMGNPFPLELPLEDDPALEQVEREKRKKQREELREQCGLYKPYGSLLKPTTVDLSSRELQHARSRFRTSLEPLLEPGTKGHLVVLGHSLRDHSLDGILRELQKGPEPEKPPPGLRLVWVDPVAHQRSRTAELGLGSPRSPWDYWMRHLLKEGIAGPLPMLAHEFVHDLWRVYRQRR